jgi:hypothetical protein
MDKYVSAIDRIVELAKPAVVEASGEQFIVSGYNQAVAMSPEHKALVDELAIEEAKLDFNKLSAFKGFSTLASLCEIIKVEIDREAACLPFLVCISDYNKVDVYGSYEVDYSRRHVYSAVSDNEHFKFGQQQLESAIITMQSKYVPEEDVGYVVDLCSKVIQNSEVESTDNGLSQKVQTAKGLNLKQSEYVKNRVMLRPFRTFMEIEQPASEFLLRLTDGGTGGVHVSLIESDGGAWKLVAKANIAAFLEESLDDLITVGKVIVLR